MRLELLEQDRRQFIKIMDKLKAFPNELKEELENFAIDSQEQMKRVAPNLTGITPGGNPSKSDGTLRRSVGFKQGAKFVEVFASAPYAGYGAWHSLSATSAFFLSRNTNQSKKNNAAPWRAL